MTEQTLASPRTSEAAAAPDDALVRAAAQGDERARGEIYRRFAGVVHGIALAHGGSQEADDLTQEVFMTVFERMGEVRGGGASLPAWIATVARHQAIDHYRRQRRRPRHVPFDESAPPAVAADGQAPADSELAERVLTRIRELPEAYRETLVLRLVEGLTGPEIAHRTGLTHGSVRVNLCRGMAMLRPLLAGEGLR